MQHDLNGKSVVLGVTGSIAAVKAALVARALAEAGAAVTCVMTESAKQFISSEEMRNATGRDVVTSIFPEQGQPPPNPRLEKAGELLEWGSFTWHVHLARSCDAMLIAPSSASTIGMLRAGIYDNAVTLVAASLVKGTPLIIVPAMDEDMWLQPAVQENLDWLKAQGLLVIEPVIGKLASGLTGMGRMPEPEEIITQFKKLLAEQPRTTPQHIPLRSAGGGVLVGKKVLITGGPTYEPIDAVRFIGNRSSGKMAAALAIVAREMGADVTLVMGPTTPFPRLEKAGVFLLSIETATEMLKAVQTEAPKADIIIMSAAVADFAPVQTSEGKMKKGSEETMTLTLKKNPDILAEIAKAKKPGQIVVGFALEKGERAEAYAKKKLVEKNLDMIVLNNIAEEGVGFGYETNKITIFRRDGNSESFPLMTKEECAKIILERLLANG